MTPFPEQAATKPPPQHNGRVKLSGDRVSLLSGSQSVKPAVCRLGRARALGLGLLLVGVTSCQPSDSSASTFSVALLLAGPENDEGWNQSAYEGLIRIRDELGARTRKVTARTRTEIEQALERAAEEGFDLVIGHGFEFNAPAFEIAQAYPEVHFVTTGGTESRDNLATVVLRLEEASYALGVLAGHLTRTHKLSALSGEEFEPVKRVVEGFRQGLQSVDPEAVVLEEYLGSWEDSALAKEKALAHAEAGADVFFQNVDAAGIGVFEACRARGFLAFGCNRDQSSKAPEVIVASAVADISEVLADLAREVAAGEFRGGLRSFGAADGKVRVTFNPKLQDRVTGEARAAVEEAVRNPR